MINYRLIFVKTTFPHIKLLIWITFNYSVPM